MMLTKLCLLTISLDCVYSYDVGRLEKFGSIDGPLAKSVNEEIVLAVDAIIKKVFSPRFNTINIISASDSKDLLSALLIKSGDEAVVRLDGHRTIVNVKVRLEKHNIILLDGIHSFRALTSTASMYDGFYLFVLFNGTSCESKEIFDTLWKRNIYNVDVIFADNDQISVVTFQPFTAGYKCSNSQPVLVNKFHNGSFRNGIDLIFPNKFKDLQNCPIKVVTFEDTYAVQKATRSDGSFELTGFDIELLEGLAKSLNFKADLRLLEIPDPWGMIHDNGSATGALGVLLNGSADIGIGNYFLKLNRLRYLDSSVTYDSFPLVFVIPPGAELSAIRKLLQPFEMVVWILMFATFVAALVTILLINLKPTKVRDFVYGTGVNHPVMNILIVIFGSSQQKLPKRNFARFILMMFTLFCLVQRSIYQGSLYIFLQSNIEAREIHSLDEMAENDFEFYLYESYADIVESQPKIVNK